MPDSPDTQHASDSPAPLDRRVRRTRRRLKEALLELIDRKPYDSITVQEICDLADTGRSTFYDHFESKEDLLFAGLERHLLEMVAEPTEDEEEAACGPEGPPRFRFSLPLLRHVRLQRRFFEATILGGSDARLRAISTGILAGLVEAELERMEGSVGGGATARARLRKDGADRDRADRARLRRGVARTVAGAFMGLLDWWLRSADDVPAETVDELFQGVVGSASPSSASRMGTPSFSISKVRPTV